MNNQPAINKLAQLLNANGVSIKQTKDQQFLELVKIFTNSKQRIPINRPTNTRSNNLSTNL